MTAAIAQTAHSIRRRARTLTETASAMPHRAAEAARGAEALSDRLADINVCRLAALMRAMRSLHDEHPRVAPCVCALLGQDLVEAEPCEGHHKMTCAPCH